jgi:hypothetical protein
MHNPQRPARLGTGTFTKLGDTACRYRSRRTHRPTSISSSATGGSNTGVLDGQAIKVRFTWSALAG